MNIAVIPAWEPDVHMITLLQEMADKAFRIIVVDDGSGEAYLPVFIEAKRYAHVISYPENRGKGYALKKAFRHLAKTSSREDTVVVMDCDGQHTPDDAQMLCEAAGDQPDTLFLGSRRQSGTSPLRSRIGNAVTRWIFRLSSGRRIRDTQTGLRAFSAGLLSEMCRIPGDRYEYEMNVLMYFARNGFPMKELPIETIYIDNNSGSHFRAMQDSWRICREIIRFSGSSLLSFLVDYAAYSAIVAGGGSSVVLAANILARMISASFNYMINRRFVFSSDIPVIRSAVRYALLAVCVLLLNTGVLYILTGILGWNPYLAKPAAELLLFVFSWFIQRTLVFANVSDIQEWR